MDYSKIRCEDIESCTLREAIVEYGNDIKPFRYTYLHEEQYRKKAIEVLQSDTKLSEVLQA